MVGDCDALQRLLQETKLNSLSVSGGTEVRAKKKCTKEVNDKLSFPTYSNYLDIQF